MSHRDKECGSGSDTNAQELSQALDCVLAGVNVEGIQFRKDCSWAVMGLIKAALLWAWSSKETLGERLKQALQVGRLLENGDAPDKTSYQAFMKMLERWTGTLRARLIPAFQACMERKLREAFRLAGFVILGADGSKIQVARTHSNEVRLAPAKTRGRKGKLRRKADRRARRPRSRQRRAQEARFKKADSPQLALTLLYHLMLRLPWDWRIGSSDTGEREQLLDMIPQLPPDALVAADCGFFGYDFWSALLASGRQFVIRVGGNVRLLRKLGVVRESNGIIYLWPDKAAKRGQPPLVLRLVVVHDGRQQWYLVSSVRDPRRLSDRQVADIYRRRWRIEVFFRHFKQTFHRAKLRSHKAEHAECEAEWSILGLWAMLLYARIQLPREQRCKTCLSVAKVLRAFGQAIDERKSVADPGESLHEQLAVATIDSNARRNKSSRGYPRKKYESQAKPPRITTAKRAQRKLARELTERMPAKGLTA